MDNVPAAVRVAPLSTTALVPCVPSPTVRFPAVITDAASCRKRAPPRFVNPVSALLLEVAVPEATKASDPSMVRFAPKAIEVIWPPSVKSSSVLPTRVRLPPDNTPAWPKPAADATLSVA